MIFTCVGVEMGKISSRVKKYRASNPLGVQYEHLNVPG